ncbi:13130_t:CDS:2 [Ambispora gerdemannii]|uniref:13130_t:CDS:1 n=1 Tax=Ambispora gerdemannii TaxID=144530 RepID=A0A9N9G868_9GLOM|nr:13130_t:CDS:2 [Ambispora gerdemannii]
MSKAQEEVAFIDWVNTFENISRTVTNYKDLADGGVLIEIACDVDPRWFKTLRGDTRGDKDNWVLKFNKLKRLYALIQRYYEEVFGYDLKNIDAPNLNTIAKESDISELVKLCFIHWPCKVKIMSPILQEFNLYPILHKKD